MTTSTTSTHDPTDDNVEPQVDPTGRAFLRDDRPMDHPPDPAEADHHLDRDDSQGQ